jgi:uncharacterized protein YndB with AHSA1/START domain
MVKYSTEPLNRAFLARSSLTLVRRIKVSPAKVYAAWTRPEQMMRWWSPDACPVLGAEADLRVGGRYRVAFRMPDGAVRECSGVYREVEPDRRLVFTWNWAHLDEPESQVTVELRTLPEGTELTLTHAQFRDEDGQITHRQGWDGALDQLERFVTSA